MTLFFIHGSGCTQTVWHAQMQAFPDARAMALPGHGGDTATPDSVGAFADAVVAELRRLDLRQAVLCGSSLGGAIALEVALRREPRVCAVALIGSGAKLRVAPALLEHLDRDFPGAARTLASMFFSDPTPERVATATSSMLAVGKAQTIADFRACDAFDATGRIAELHLPLLALAGEGDVLTPPKFAQFFVDRVAGATVRIVPGAGHLAMVEQPDAVNEALRAFVQPSVI